MEVHHHPKAIGSRSSRKKWSHYLWEFLMQFGFVFIIGKEESLNTILSLWKQDKTY